MDLSQGSLLLEHGDTHKSDCQILISKTALVKARVRWVNITHFMMRAYLLTDNITFLS